MAFSFTSRVKPGQRGAGEGQEQEGKAKGRQGRAAAEGRAGPVLWFLSGPGQCRGSIKTVRNTQKRSFRSLARTGLEAPRLPSPVEVVPFWGIPGPVQVPTGSVLGGPVLVPRRPCSGTGFDVGATVPMAVERRASAMVRSAPSRSRGLSAAHPRRWAAYALSLGFSVLGFRV